MRQSSKSDQYLERLRSIQAETAGIDARLNALEKGQLLNAESIDAIVRAKITKEPARYEDFLTEAQIKNIALKYRNALNKGVDCDALDYALSAACGLVSGLIDLVFVGSPGEGAAEKASDELFNSAVIRFAKTVKNDEGDQLWKPRKDNENKVAAAIGFLEKQFAVGYDQAKTIDTFHAVPSLNPNNHHAKSASHYPDFIGLIASICNQFYDTSTFLDSTTGHILIVPRTDNGVELLGKSPTAKVYAGAINWFGHCMSDIAGSSNSKKRGAGLPLPIWEFFELCNFGKFPDNSGERQSFGTVMTQVYEQGYDLRHGVSTTFPVFINDLLISAMFTIRRHFAMGISWSECFPKNDCPELQRMLTVGTGSLCLINLGHAAITSWGNWVKFFGSLNITAWARFGLQSVHELQIAAERDTRNLSTINNEISQDWSRLLDYSKTLLK